ncbi:MAG TPA: hypothetical protein VK327_11265 [Candidatus Paceibacterota bacterium]|nr:hypothetical protein [Candidatus Paceibacterota bacterium]
MKHPHSNRNNRPKSKEDTRTNPAEALRKCEEASARLKAASEELTACWTALGIEIATGARPTELLRRRAWCNVLEMRLREKAVALEKARQDLDKVWNAIMDAASQRERRELARLASSTANVESIFSRSWSLLMQSKSPARTRSLAAK